MHDKRVSISVVCKKNTKNQNNKYKNGERGEVAQYTGTPMDRFLSRWGGGGLGEVLKDPC